MTLLAPPVGQALPGTAASPSKAWIESPAYDLTFFIMAPLLTLPILGAEMLIWRPFAIAGFLLAFAHYLSTGAFLLWDDNRPQFRRRWVAFAVGPLALVSVYFGIVAFGVPLVIPFVLLFWNTYHVARQSCGLASIYRHRAGVTDLAQKRVTNTAIISSNLWFTLWNVESNPEVIAILSAPGPLVPGVVWAVTGAVALVALARLGVALWRRTEAGQAPTLPEAAALVTGLALFHPYLWLATSGGATYAMLLPHYVQYLGLVWLLHRRRFPEPSGSLPQRILQRVSAHPLRVATFLLALSGSVYVVKVVAVRAGGAQHFETFYLLVAFLHFYLDALIWAFKDPHVRRTMAPYLMRGARGAR
jgi:hypothetical protein